MERIVFTWKRSLRGGTGMRDVRMEGETTQASS